MTPREQAQQFLDLLRARDPSVLEASLSLPPAVVKNLKDWIAWNEHERTTLFPGHPADPSMRAEWERIIDRAAEGDTSGLMRGRLAEEQDHIEKALATRVTVRGKAPDIRGRTLVGFLSRGQVGATTRRVPKSDAYLIVFEDAMLSFTHHLSYAIALAFSRKESADTNSGVALSLDIHDLAGRLEAHPEIADRFADIVVTYARTGMAGVRYGGAEDRLPSGYLGLAAVLDISLTYFVLGHEYAHIVLGHVDLPSKVFTEVAAAAGIEVPEDFAQAYSWMQELDADVFGMKLALSAGVHYGGIDVQSNFMGAGLYFAAMEMMDRAFALLETGDENASQLGSHPPAETRRRHLREALAKMTYDELAHDAEAVQIALDQDEAEAEIIRLLWERVRPVLLDLHRRGVRPARTWRATPKETSSGDSPPGADTDIAMLVESAKRSPDIATTQLNPLLRAHPRLALAAGSATLITLAGLPDLDPSILQAVEDLLPAGRHTEWDTAAAAVTERLTAHRLRTATDPASKARLLGHLGWRYRNAGLTAQTLTAAEEAARLYRTLAEASPAVYLPDLARTLSHLGVALQEAGRREDALAPAEEAVAIHHRLTEANPTAHLPDYADALTNLGNQLSDVGRREDALAPAEEAVGIYRLLGKANPDDYLPRLSRALTNLGNRLSEVGRREDALAPAEEAARLYRTLAEASPAVYLPDLAMALDNLGCGLEMVGRRQDALAATEEAVAIQRTLAEANPDAHLPGLARALSNLGGTLEKLRRPEEALAPTEEAVAIRRTLAEANPGAYLPDLAGALSNLGIQLSQLGRHTEALAPTEEAVRHYRTLAGRRPAVYLPGLATALHTFAWVRASGPIDMDRAREAIEESLTIYQRIAEAHPDVFAEDIDRTLRTYADITNGLSGRGST